MTKGQWLLLIVAVLFLMRALLPKVLTSVINRKLASLEGYAGSIDDVDLSFLRGRFAVRGFRLWEIGHETSPLARIDRVDLSLVWNQLVRGRFVASIFVRRPVLSLSKEDAKAAQEAKGAREAEEAPAARGEEVPFPDVLRRLIPFKIERFRVLNGAVSFRNPGTDPPQKAWADDIYMSATNLTNSSSLSDTLFASVTTDAHVMDSGQLRVSAKINPLAKKPTFDLDYRLQGLALNRLNEYFRAYANFDVERGTFSMAGEASVRNGKIDGYVKPALEGVKVLVWKKDARRDNKGPFRLLWEGTVEAVKNVLEHPSPQDQVATRIPLKGELASVQTDLFQVIGSLLYNAFVQAILPRLEHSVNL
jgi:hypothetical protein